MAHDDMNTPELLRAITDKRLRDAIEKGLKTLTFREKEVLKLSYGLEDGYTYTNEEIGQIFGVDSDRIQQVLATAEEKFENSRPIRRIRERLSNEPGQQHNLKIRKVVSEVQKLTPELMKHLKAHHEDLSEVPWDVYEELIAEFFASWGFDSVELVGSDHKTGADVLATQKQEKPNVTYRYFIEVKKWQTKVDVSVIDKVYGAMKLEEEDHGSHLAMVVSHAGFTDFNRYSKDELEFKGIQLRDEGNVRDWLDGYKPSDKGLWLPDGFQVSGGNA